MGNINKIKESKVTVILFWYETSIFSEENPNKQFDIFDSIKDIFGDKVRIIKIDTIKTINKELAENERIRTFPLLQIYSNGLKLYETQGFISEKSLTDKVLDSYAHTHDNELDN